MADEQPPITAINIVADPNKCSPGFELLMKSNDRGEDCDLWKDGLFRSKVTRYICISRAHMNQQILTSITINNEKDSPPTGFSVIDCTVDSNEKATQKKQICVKYEQITSCNQAVVDIILLSKSKRPPVNYILVGEINSFSLCMKIGPILPSSNTFNNFFPPMAGINNMPPPMMTPIGKPPVPLPRTARLDGILNPDKVLEGVEFTLHPMYQNNLQSFEMTSLPEIPYNSVIDIEREYQYDFLLEKSVTGGR